MTCALAAEPGSRDVSFLNAAECWQPRSRINYARRSFVPSPCAAILSTCCVTLINHAGHVVTSHTARIGRSFQMGLYNSLVGSGCYTCLRPRFLGHSMDIWGVTSCLLTYLFSERSIESLQFYRTNIFSLPLWDRVGGFELQWAQLTLAETTRLVAPSGEWQKNKTLRDECCCGCILLIIYGACLRLVPPSKDGLTYSGWRKENYVTSDG